MSNFWVILLGVGDDAFSVVVVVGDPAVMLLLVLGDLNGDDVREDKLLFLVSAVAAPDVAIIASLPIG